jgi:hypothetical protein
MKEIIIKLQVEGIHHWPECNIEEVLFLRDKHRHIFYITVVKEVTHNDRDIEIIKLKREIKKYLGNEPIDFGRKSCEDIAEDILKKYNCSEVIVLEDNENGARIKK